MIKVFLDTSYKTLRIGIWRNDVQLTYSEENSDRRFTEIATNKLVSELKHFSLAPKDVDEMYIVTGPGSFTGVRVGLTIAKIWYILNPDLKIYTCDSLTLQVHGLDKPSLIDARGQKDYYLQNGKMGICEKGEIITSDRDFNQYHFRPTDLNWFKLANNPLLLKPIYIKKAIN